MSLLSLNAIRIYSAPAGLAAVARRRFWPGPAQAAAWNNPEPQPADWRATLPPLQEIVGELGGGKVDLILSGHFFRYQILPWQDGLENPDEAQACARYALTQTYGSEAESWMIALSDDPPGEARIAAAFDPDLLAGVKAAVAGGGGRLHSIRPGLMVALNAWRRAVGDGEATWFVVHESGLLTLALVEQGQWRWIRTRRAGGAWQERLTELLADEAVMLGIEPGQAAVLVVCPEESGGPGQPIGSKVLSLADALKRQGLPGGRTEFAWMA